MLLRCRGIKAIYMDLTIYNPPARAETHMDLCENNTFDRPPSLRVETAGIHLEKGFEKQRFRGINRDWK